MRGSAGMAFCLADNPRDIFWSRAIRHLSAVIAS